MNDKIWRQSSEMARALVDHVMGGNNYEGVKPQLIRDELNRVLGDYPKGKMKWTEDIEKGELYCLDCQQIILTMPHASIAFYYLEQDEIRKITELIAWIFLKVHHHIGEKHLL